MLSRKHVRRLVEKVLPRAQERKRKIEDSARVLPVQRGKENAWDELVFIRNLHETKKHLEIKTNIYFGSPSLS